jgi:hypothetical protein
MTKENKLKEQGYVYVILDNHDRVKIGKSLNPERRIKGIASASGIEIIDSYITEPLFGYSEFEHFMHEQFKEYRGVGEWFNCRFDDVITFIETTDMTDFTKEQYLNCNFTAESIAKCLADFKIQRLNDTIEPLIEIMESMVGIKKIGKEGIKYYITPELKDRIEAVFARELENFKKKNETINKFEYLLNKCEALEKLNDNLYEESYLNSEILSRLTDTTEFDSISIGYKDMKQDLILEQRDLLDIVMKPYISSDYSEVK